MFSIGSYQGAGGQGPPGAGLENTQPYVVPTYDASGTLIYGHVFKDTSGQDVFDFSAQQVVDDPDPLSHNYIDAKITSVAGDANERQAWEQVRDGLLSLEEQIANLTEVLENLKLIR